MKSSRPLRKRAQDEVLVAGAAGYLGSMLVPRLLEAGYRVVALDSFARNEPALANHCANEQFEPVRGDARDETLVKSLLKQHIVERRRYPV